MKSATALFLCSAVLLAACGETGTKLPDSMLSSGAATGSKTDKPDTIKIGKRVDTLASGSFDPKCERLVKPYDLETSFNDLADQATTQIGLSIQSMLGGTGFPSASQFTKGRQQYIETVKLIAKTTNWLPMSTEVMLGEMDHEKFKTDILERDSRNGRKIYPEADRMLQQVLATIDEPYDYKFTIYVLARDGGNAKALAGGIVYVDQDLFKDEKSKSKAFFALGHEISHVLQRHETRLLQARLIDAVSMTGSVPDMIAMIRQPQDKGLAIMRVAMAGKIVFARHYSGQELQADACAVRIIKKGYNDDSKVLTSITEFKTSLKIDTELRESAAPAPDDGKTGAKPPIDRNKTVNMDKQSLGDMLEMVAQPMDSHPTDAERIKNLDMMYAEVRERLPKEQAKKPTTQPIRKSVAPAKKDDKK